MPPLNPAQSLQATAAFDVILKACRVLVAVSPFHGILVLLSNRCLFMRC
jgi:hypothetical protein